MNYQFNLEDIPIEVTFKKIKNLYLRVHPPTGIVRISAPLRVDREHILAFAASKLGWIRKQQRKLKYQPSPPPRVFSDGEVFSVWGERYVLQLSQTTRSARVQLVENRMLLYVRPQASLNAKRDVIEKWYRAQVLKNALSLLAIWEPKMGVKVDRIYVRRMKTLWGSCNKYKRSIRLNTELAARPRQSLEYLVIHELTHLLEPSHNKRFVSLMNNFLPDWKARRAELNRFPLGSLPLDE